jgi:subtilisin-like proprotein convertase family protein
MSARLLVPLALAACIDAPAGAPDAGGSAATTAAISAADITGADHCRVTSVTCSAAQIECTGVAATHVVVDQWRHTYAPDESGAARYAIARPWTGRYMSAVCSAGSQSGADASVVGCEVEIDTVALPPACEQRTWTAPGNPVPLPSDSAGGVQKSLAVTGGARRPLAIVAVDINHAHRDDLTVTLLPPGAAPRTLHDGDGGAGPDLRRTYLVPATGGGLGTWRMRVADGPGAGTGIFRSWSLRLVASCNLDLPCSAGLTEYCPSNAAHGLALRIPDLSSRSNAIEVIEQGVAGDIVVDVDLDHPIASDVEIRLTAPGGQTARLWDREGGNAPLTRRTFAVGQLAGAARQGHWVLAVFDRAGNSQTGILNGWSLRTRPVCI